MLILLATILLFVVVLFIVSVVLSYVRLIFGVQNKQEKEVKKSKKRFQYFNKNEAEEVDFEEVNDK